MDYTTLHKCIGLFMRAVEADKKQNFVEALDLYGKAVEQLDRFPLKAYDKKLREKVFIKKQKYVDRTARIRAYLVKRQFTGDERNDIDIALDPEEGRHLPTAHEALGLLVRSGQEERWQNHSEAIRLFDEAVQLMETLPEDVYNDSLRERVRYKQQMYATAMYRLGAQLAIRQPDADVPHNADEFRKPVQFRHADDTYKCKDSLDGDESDSDSENCVTFCNLCCCSFFLTKRKSTLIKKK